MSRQHTGRRSDTIQRVISKELGLLNTLHSQRVLCRLLDSPVVRVYLPFPGERRVVTINWIGGVLPAHAPRLSKLFPGGAIQIRRSPTSEEVLAAVNLLSQALHATLPVTTFTPPPDSLEPGVKLGPWQAFQLDDMTLEAWVERLINHPCPVPTPTLADVTRALTSSEAEVRELAIMLLPHAVP